MQSMNLTTLSAAIILALSTAACSSGGSHSTTSTSPVITEQTAAEKAAAEKAAAEKAAAEKAAAEKAAAEKAAAEKAAAEKAAAEKAAAEKAAAEKAAAEKAAAEKAAAEKAAAEKAAAEKLAREEVLYKKALSIGLTEDRAKNVASNQSDTTVTQQNGAINNAALNQAKEIKNAIVQNDYGQDLSNLVSGLSYKSIDQSSLNNKDQYTQRTGNHYIYQQPYSITVGTWLHVDIKDDINQLVENRSTYNVDVAGFATQAVAIPTEGKASYTGLGIHTSDRFDLTYNVDFGKRTGSGALLKATEYGGRILLEEGNISKINLKGNDVIGISSSAKALNGSTGIYTVGFYGTQAQEIAGSLEMNQSFLGNRTNINGKTEIGLGATRGEISK